MPELRRYFYAGAIGLWLFAGNGCSTAPVRTLSDLPDRQAFRTCDLRFTAQNSESDCGLAAIHSVALYWNRQYQFANAQGFSKPAGPAGYSLGQLEQLCRSLELSAYLVSYSPFQQPTNQLINDHLVNGRPVITPLQENSRTPGDKHFVVVMGYSEEEILIMDPGSGYRSLARRDFAQAWARSEHAALICAE